MEKKVDPTGIIFRRSCNAHALISDAETSSQLHTIRNHTHLSERYPPACTCYQVVLDRAMPKASSGSLRARSALSLPAGARPHC